jgi:N-methylhydantoinase B/oxoprolinase/acetone carboxylase alpha subunit
MVLPAVRPVEILPPSDAREAALVETQLTLLADRRRRGPYGLAGGGEGEGADTTRLVARVSPRTRIAEGSTIELTVDTSRLYFFDPETGLGIYQGSNSKGAE